MDAHCTIFRADSATVRSKLLSRVVMHMFSIKSSNTDFLTDAISWPRWRLHQESPRSVRWYILREFRVSRSKSRTLCRSNISMNASRISLALSHRETALSGRYELAILGIRVIMTSVHQSTRDQQRFSWDSSCIWISGEAQGESHISIDLTSHRKSIASLIH